MKARTVILGRLQQVLRQALDAAGLQTVEVYPLADPQDVWAIPSCPAVGCCVTRRHGIGPLPMGGGNSTQSIVLKVGMAYLNDDPGGPTTAITDAMYGTEALANACELAIRSADLADGSVLQGPIRLVFVDDEHQRSPFGHDQRGGGLLALLQTFETTQFYE